MMKKFKLTKLFFALFILLISINTNAQDIGFGDDVQDNAPASPIDSNLWILMAAGLIFVGYKFYKFKKKGVSA